MKCKTCGTELAFEWLKKAGAPKSLIIRTRRIHQNGLCMVEPSEEKAKAVVKACRK